MFLIAAFAGSCIPKVKTKKRDRCRGLACVLRVCFVCSLNCQKGKGIQWEIFKYMVFCIERIKIIQIKRNKIIKECLEIEQSVHLNLVYLCLFMT